MDPVVMQKFQSPKEQWREEGREEGRDQGRQTGRCEMLLRQLSIRFGVLPEQMKSRLQQANLEQLDDWAIRLLDASSLRDVFGD